MSAERNELQPDAEERRVGQLFSGKWKIEHLLGTGAAGAVYAARHRNGNRVAIKVARSRWAALPEMRERFLNEARASNLVTHRGIARVHDEGVTEDGSIFLVMDLLEGRTLEEHLQIHGPISPEQALVVAHELLDVLAAAHPVDVLHRDIKPANVYLNWDGRVVLLDFGVARLSDAMFHTQTGVPVGTPAYMPPEQARGRWTEVDARSDLWSLGATLFNSLTGQTVRASSSLAEELSGAIQGHVRSLGTVRELPEPIVALVDCALAPDLADRFSSALHMREAVREAMVALGMPLPTPSELPGARAGLAPSAPEFPRDERHSSAIRLKQSPPTLLAPSEDGQWATNDRKLPSPAKYALVALLACVLAYVLWRPTNTTPPLELRSELGTFCRVRAGVVAVVHVDAVDTTIGRVSTALGRLRAAALGELEVADTPPRASRGRVRRAAIRGPRALPEPPTAEATPTTPTESEPVESEPVQPEPVGPQPFDPLEDRL